MAQWDYMLTLANSNVNNLMNRKLLEDQLKTLGRDEWELISVVKQDNTLLHYWKRLNPGAAAAQAASVMKVV